MLLGTPGCEAIVGIHIEGLTAGRGAALCWLRLGMVDALLVVSCRRQRKRRQVADDADVVFVNRVIDARGPPSKDGPCPRASIEEPIVQFDLHHQPE